MVGRKLSEEASELDEIVRQILGLPASLLFPRHLLLLSLSTNRTHMTLPDSQQREDSRNQNGSNKNESSHSPEAGLYETGQSCAT